MMMSKLLEWEDTVNPYIMRGNLLRLVTASVMKDLHSPGWMVLIGGRHIGPMHASTKDAVKWIENEGIQRKIINKWVEYQNSKAHRCRHIGSEVRGAWGEINIWAFRDANGWNVIRLGGWGEYQYKVKPEVDVLAWLEKNRVSWLRQIVEKRVGK